MSYKQLNELIAVVGNKQLKDLTMEDIARVKDLDKDILKQR